MTQVLTPSKEEQGRLAPPIGDRPTKRRIVIVTVAAVLIGILVGLVLAIGGKAPTADESRFAVMPDFYKAQWQAEQAATAKVQQLRFQAMPDFYEKQWLADQSHAQLAQQARYAAMADYYERLWKAEQVEQAEPSTADQARWQAMGDHYYQIGRAHV